MEAASVFAEAGLELPPLPPAFEGSLQRLDKGFYSTRPLKWTLYDLDRFQRELVEGPRTQPYAAFGFGGHGLVSQAVHCYLVTERYAAFVQLAWGMNTDFVETRKRWSGYMLMLRMLEKAADTAARAGRLAPDRLLLSRDSDFRGAAWTWLYAGAEPEWRKPAASALLDAVRELERLARDPR